MRSKLNRVYPYSNGLMLGCELDVILTNENSEPVDASELLDAKDWPKSTTRAGGDESAESNGENTIKIHKSLIRLHSRQSYCRAYTTDNIWWMLKSLVKGLKKKAQLSYVPAMWGGSDSLEEYIAGGHMKCSVRRDEMYGGDTNRDLFNMTYKKIDESHERLKNNFRVTIGLLSLLLDQRVTAERRRKLYGPFCKKEFRVTNMFFTYQTPTNWWLFSPMLAHLMFGAVRMAYFITLNKIEKEIWEGFEPGDVNNAIYSSSYDTGKEIWDLVNRRLGDSGYKESDNPFWQQRARLIEFFMEYGVGIIGDGVYKNWRMSRKMTNYQGHFRDLAGWESGAYAKVFTKKHPQIKLLNDFLGKK